VVEIKRRIRLLDKKNAPSREKEKEKVGNHD